MNYKYKLIEQEEDSGLKGLRAKNELILTAKGGLQNADDLLKIINDPKNLKDVFAIESRGLDDLISKVFGNKAKIPANVNLNKQIYQENGIALYKKIEDTVGKKLDKKSPVIKKDKEGKVLFAFPEITKYNKDIVEAYYNMTSEGKQAKKSSLSPKKVDDLTLKFPVGDEATLKKILKNAGLTTDDYKIEKQEISENAIRETIKNQLRKLLKENLSTAEKLIKQAEKEGHIKGDYSQMVLDTAKKIAKKWDELNPEEQKVMRDTYYQSFLKKIKK